MFKDSNEQSNTIVIDRLIMRLRSTRARRDRQLQQQQQQQQKAITQAQSYSPVADVLEFVLCKLPPESLAAVAACSTLLRQRVGAFAGQAC
jgi:hypothetical protein